MKRPLSHGFDSSEGHWFLYSTLQKIVVLAITHLFDIMKYKVDKKTNRCINKYYAQKQMDRSKDKSLYINIPYSSNLSSLCCAGN